MIVSKVSSFTGKTNQMELDITQEQIKRFLEGEKVQDVFPNLNAGQREVLLNGTTPEEWNEVFGNA